MIATQNIPSQVGHGWESSEGQVLPVLMTKEPAPESLVELASCCCSKSPWRDNCSCKNSSLACTEACVCMGDSDCENPNKMVAESSDSEDSDGE